MIEPSVHPIESRDRINSASYEYGKIARIGAAFELRLSVEKPFQQPKNKLNVVD